MNARQLMSNERDLLRGNLNRMAVTDDPEELEDMYKFAKKRVDTIYVLCKERLEARNEDK